MSYYDMLAADSELDLASAEYAALAHFRHALLRYLHFSEGSAARRGLEPRHYQLLLLLRGLGHDGGASISELADWLEVRHHTAVELVDRMAAHRLVARHPYPNDRRRVLVSLTRTGRTALARLAVLHRDELRRLAPGLIETLRQIVTL